MAMRCHLSLLILLVGLGLASATHATVVHGNFSGTNVDFLGVQETTSSGDPEPLWGAPIVVGDQLLFFPPAFAAESIGGGVDQTSSQLQLTMMGQTALDTIDTVNISEFGDANLAGGGTAATGVFMGMAGFITVLEVLGVAVAPTVIPFVGVFVPGDTLTLTTDPGTTIWTGTASIDVASVVPNVTKAFLSLDNDLFAFSEAGTIAKTQKKVVDGPAVIIEVIPEPATGLMVLGGILGLAIRARHRRV